MLHPSSHASRDLERLAINPDSTGDKIQIEKSAYRVRKGEKQLEYVIPCIIWDLSFNLFKMAVDFSVSS